MGWLQAQRQVGRSGAGSAGRPGDTRRCSTYNSRMAPALLGCKRPKLREGRSPLGNTCCSTSHKKSASGSVRCAILPVLAPVLVALALPRRARVGLTLVRHSPCLASNLLIDRNCND